MLKLRVARLLTAMLLTSSCVTQQKVFNRSVLVFRTVSDLGVPLSGVSVSIDQTPLGQSSGGHLTTTLDTNVSRSVKVQYACPSGYLQPAQGISVGIRSVHTLDPEKARPIEVTLTCVAKTHIAGFVIQTRRAPALPVLVEGVEVGRTNSLGVAWFTHHGAPGTEYTVKIDTAAHATLIPASPTRVFTLDEHHQVFVFDQAFAELRRQGPLRPRRPRIIKIE
ncbi:MAG: hypothetical protein WBG86_14890 [Polyangiales bacterium]